MKLNRCGVVWLAAVLVLVTTREARGQQPQQPQRPAQVELLQNYPNPFNPATTIPFRLSETLWQDGRRPVVSLRIYNVLAQLVAVPSLQQSGQKLENITLDCQSSSGGYCDFSAYWDGHYEGTTREAASGVYVYQLIVNGQRQSRRMIVMK